MKLNEYSIYKAGEDGNGYIVHKLFSPLYPSPTQCQLVNSHVIKDCHCHGHRQQIFYTGESQPNV